MPTKAQWEQYIIDEDQWQKTQQKPYVTSVKSLLLAHKDDPASTEIGFPGSNPSSPPPIPPGS